jgi:hypothetical protein
MLLAFDGYSCALACAMMKYTSEVVAVPAPQSHSYPCRAGSSIHKAREDLTGGP